MASSSLLLFVGLYFALLLVVAYYTSKSSDNNSFFIGNRNSNWLLVAFGMIGTSLSGVTFVSVPGTVGSNAFQYFQVVIGFYLGYFIVAYILLPLYYRMQLTSIYTYLQERIGMSAYKTGSFFFIISRTLGATARLYLVVNILQRFILEDLGVPFWITTCVILLLILLYTFEGGVKTIVYTDTLQTTFMIVGLLAAIFTIKQFLNIDMSTLWSQLKGTVLNASDPTKAMPITKVFNTDPLSASFFLKQIIGGIFITVGMTGLDQEMMQKNISVNSLKGAQKNMISYSTVLVLINGLFLLLGACLYLFAQKNGLDVKGDDLFPHIALKSGLGATLAILFVIGLISALFPSADGALTSLTSAYCIDIIGINRNNTQSEDQKKRTRLTVHLSFTLIFFLCTMIFKWIDNRSIIDVILKLAGYTYGPLLGLFIFGVFTKRVIDDRKVLPIAIIAPLIMLVLDLINNADFYIKKLSLSPNTASTLEGMQKIFGGYKIGHELLLMNGLLTFFLLVLFSKKSK